MRTQRPLTSRVATKRLPSNRSASQLTRTSQNISRPKAFNEKQIAARREKEQQNLEKWQKADRYFREMKARLDLFEHWDKREELRRSRSTGSHLDHLGLKNSAHRSLNHLNSLSYSNRIEELDMYWSTDQLVTESNQQLAEKIKNQLCSELINELYTIDPRKIPYDIDLDLLRKPEALDKLKKKVKKQENRLKELKEDCLNVKKKLKLKQKSKNSLINHKNQLEQIYLEYSKNWLTNWQQRMNRLDLKCSDEELSLLFPARRGQIKGKDRLRLRNNLVSEHFNRSRQLLIQIRKISGYYKMKNLTINKKQKNDHKPCDKQNNLDENLEKENNNEMQSHLSKLLTNDERNVLANLLRTTINMLDTFTKIIKRRASLYSALFDEEAKEVWKNESNDLNERTKVCIKLMAKIYQLYSTVYSDKISSLDQQINELTLELENKIELFDNFLDNLKQNPSKALILNLIDRSLLTFVN